MDGPLFHVEITALENASADIRASIEGQARQGLTDVTGSPEMYGHAELHRAMSGFCNRWTDGLDILHEDAGAISDLLSRVAEAYRATDQASAATLTVDPGKPVIDD